MKTKLKIIIIGIIVILAFVSLLYVPAYFECSEGLQLDLSCSFHDVFVVAPEIRHYTMVKASCNNSEGKPDGQCFVNAFENCESAKIKQMSFSFEGDPIFYYATIVPEDSCRIHFEMDISLDKWKGVATPGIIQDTCTYVQFSEPRLDFQCGDEQYVIQLR